MEIPKEIPEIRPYAAPQENGTENLAPMATEAVHAGFPSPATDYMDGVIDLNKELVRHPESTFYGRVAGDSMIDAGVFEGDILVIDKSLEPQEGDMAVCFVDGEFALKYISFHDPGTPSRHSGKAQSSYNILPHREMWLLPANKTYKPVHVTESNDFTIWGTVTYVIHKTK